MDHAGTAEANTSNALHPAKRKDKGERGMRIPGKTKPQSSLPAVLGNQRRKSRKTRRTAAGGEQVDGYAAARSGTHHLSTSLPA
ncbi:hypothetical protein GCM10011408_41730 [Dyella caseinilytica]|nr:hypothetical protein GCM10011408_41730 [Dyella caseinilytica]